MSAEPGGHTFLFDWILIICFVSFKFKLSAHVCISHNGDGKNYLKPKLLIQGVSFLKSFELLKVIRLIL